MTPCPQPTLANERTSAKATLRKRLRAERAGQDAATIQSASNRIMERLSALVRPGATVAVYAPLPHEVQLDANALLAAGAARVAWPRIGADRSMAFFAGGSLRPTGSWGIREPDPVDPVAPDQFDAVIVPGLAFTTRGERLGMGAGHYDRFLPQLRPGVPRWAVAFDWQVLPELPVEPHDALVSHVVTELRLIHCSSHFPTQGHC